MSVEDLLWRIQCRLNRRLPLATVPVQARLLPEGASIDVLASAADARAVKADLCVVMTTYDRVAACTAQVRALHAALAVAGWSDRVFVLVLVDASEASYAPALDELTALFPNRFALYRSTSHLGKRAFWRMYQAAFDAVRALGARFALFVQDDLTFGDTFLHDAFARWDAVEDDRKLVLSLFATTDDEPNGRWIEHRRSDLPAAGVRRTQWFDLPAFLANRRFFELLRFEVFPVPSGRWAHDAGRSSGVGEQLTRRLLGRGNVYQVRETLVYHGEHASLMNAQARAVRQFDNRPGPG
jgi:hypothetical protein